MFKNIYSMCSIALTLVVGSITMQAQHPWEVATNGMRFNTQSGTTQFVKYNPSSNTTEVLKDFGGCSVLVGSSTLSPQNGVYYITYTTDGKNYTLAGVNATTGELQSEISTSADAIKETEFDYKTGSLYGIRAIKNLQDSNLTNPSYTVQFVRANPTTSSIELIREITEFNQVVVNTSCYNSNTGEYIVAAKNTSESMSETKLYYIDAASGTINRSSAALPFRVNALNYNNRNNTLVGFATTESNLMQLVSINQQGEIEVLHSQKFSALFETHVAFDQMKSLLIARVVDTELYKPHTIVFNVESKQFLSNIQTVVASDAVHEWEINNQEFATMFYKTSTVDESTEQQILLHPNPVQQDICTISNAQNFAFATVYSTTGEQLLTSNSPRLNLSALATGCYTVHIHSSNGLVHSRTVLVTR